MSNNLNLVIQSKLEKLGKNFVSVLKWKDEENHSLFDWFQGVGLYGFYKLYKLTGSQTYLKIMTEYYEEQIGVGLPSKHVNSMAPMLTMCFLNEELKNQDYEKILLEWSDYLFNHLKRASNGAFQHTTSESNNDDQLWDDTLFMSVLFLAKAGIVFQKKEYVEDAIYQFLEHTKYLFDTSTGLWFHGYNLKEKHNYGRALWGRGNSWVTIFIPEFLDILSNYPMMPSLKRYMVEVLNCQIEALAKYQSENGLWHTLIDDPTSYLESSATSGFGYGILKSVRKEYVDRKYEENGLKALKVILEQINDEGVLELVSGGTRMGMDKEFYKNIPLKPEAYGQAMAMLILIEGLNLK